MTRNRTEAILPSEVISELGERLQESPLQPTDDPQKDLGPEPLTTINDTYSGSLDDAASLLLRQLTPSIRDYALELADIVLKIPRWQLVLGTVLCQFESGNLQAPSIDPGWRQIEVAVGTSTCGQCKKTFVPKRFGQLYCSPECGNLARKAEIDRINKGKAEELKFRKKVEAAEMGGVAA